MKGNENTILREYEPGTAWVDTDPSMNERREIARRHFVEYCDTGKCIRDTSIFPNKTEKNWHEWPCTECAFNPYIMLKP